MTYRNVRPDAGRHAQHDRLLIAAHAAGDLTGRDLDQANALLAECSECRALAGELETIRATTHALPPPVRPQRLDFRLTPAQAEQLDRGRGWRSLLRPFGARSGSTRPLAAAFTTLGVAGLLLAALPGFLGSGFLSAGAGGAAPAEVRQEHETSNPASAPDPDDLGSEGNPYVTDGNTDSNEYSNSGGKDTMGGEPTEAPGRVTAGSGSRPTPAPTEAADLFAQQSRDVRSNGPSPLVLLSVGFLGAGLGLVLLRLAARRLD